MLGNVHIGRKDAHSNYSNGGDGIWGGTGTDPFPDQIAKVNEWIEEWGSHAIGKAHSTHDRRWFELSLVCHKTQSGQCFQCIPRSHRFGL